MVDSPNRDVRGMIEVTRGPSPVRSHDKNPPTRDNVTASQARPNTVR
jgi:hypothetical protein